MAQAGVGKSVVGVGEQNVSEELKPLVGPPSLQRSQREDLYYSQQPQNGRGVSMSSPANSLGTESLVTPNTTPEPSGSPRTLDQEPLVIPPPTISTPYDRYMQTPPMNVPPYMAYPFYSQPTVYLVHPSMSYIPHPMEPMHMSYDLSVPPPNLGYMPMASHMFPHSMYKVAPQERFVPYEQQHSQMSASPMGGAAPPQVPQSNEVMMAAHRAETPVADFLPDQLYSQTSSGEPFDDSAVNSAAVQQVEKEQQQQLTTGGNVDGSNDVIEVTELIEEIQIVDPKTSTTPVPPVESSSNVDRWYDSVANEHRESSVNVRGPAEDGTNQEQFAGNVQKKVEVNNNNNQTSNREERHARDAYHRSDNQRYPSNNRRDKNFREGSNSRYDHDRRSVTPDKRGYRNGNLNYRNPSDRRFQSNPEHAANQYRPKRTRDNFRGDNYENQGGSRESSAVRRGDNRQRYFTSPRREEEYRRYDGNVRRTGSYRNNYSNNNNDNGGGSSNHNNNHNNNHNTWRDDCNNNNNRNDDPPKPVPRGRQDRERTDSAHRNNRRPPIATRHNADAPNAPRSRASNDDSLEFLLPSAVGVKEPLDMKCMASEGAVSMNCIASQKASSRQDQCTGAGKKANRHVV